MNTQLTSSLAIYITRHIIFSCHEILVSHSVILSSDIINRHHSKRLTVDLIKYWPVFLIKYKLMNFSFIHTIKLYFNDYTNTFEATVLVIKLFTLVQNMKINTRQKRILDTERFRPPVVFLLLLKTTKYFCYISENENWHSR